MGRLLRPSLSGSWPEALDALSSCQPSRGGEPSHTVSTGKPQPTRHYLRHVNHTALPPCNLLPPPRAGPALLPEGPGLDGEAPHTHPLLLP